jgi:DNA-binding MarR family transcriptional regulator
MNMDFYQQAGKMALGSRLRRLSELITNQAREVYDLYEVDMEPKWFPVFTSLSDSEGKTITQIAQEIGHSHPSVSKMVRELVKKGYVTEKPGESDGRKNFITLSETGKLVNEKMKVQNQDVTAAIENAFSETQYNLWKAIEEWEFLLAQKSLLKRVTAEKKLREGSRVRIVPYESKYRQAFKELNAEWINTWFKLEEADLKALDNPEGYILEKGGHILIALYEEEAVGACALIKAREGTFELAKMAVTPRAKGRNIGFLLGQAALDKARSLGARRVYLESNTRLVPAINLYHKLGFKKITGEPSPYERCNIQMDLIL